MIARVTLHSTAQTDTNEWLLAASVAKALAPEFQVQIVSQRRSILSALRRSHALIVHSPLGFSLGAIFLAKLLRRPVTAFVWDLYPVRIHGRRYNRRLRRLIADAIEWLALRLSDHLIVQTRDFLSSAALARAQVIPFWYAPSASVSRVTRNTEAADNLRFAFAGQINRTRGLPETVAALDAMLNKKASLHIYSRDPFDPPTGLRNLTVYHRGHMSMDELAQSLAEDDIGLVSLHPGFDGPAFPSKSLNYLAAGLPIAYFGPVLEHYAALLEQTSCGIAAGTSPSTDFDHLTVSQSNFQHCVNSFFDQIRADPVRLKSHFANAVVCNAKSSHAGSTLAPSDSSSEK